MDMLHYLFVEFDGSIHSFLSRTIYIIMSLHADTMDRHTGIFHLLHHGSNTFALHRVALVIVVIEQQSVGVCLMGIFESLGDELVTTELIHRTLTVGILCLGVVSHRLVHHVPAVDKVLITADHCIDVLLHAGIEYLLVSHTLIHPFANL